MRESTLTNKIKKALRLKGGIWFKIHGGAMQTTGIPDIVGCYRGRFVAFEVKVPGKESTLTPRQAWTLNRIRFYGGFSAMVTSYEAAVALLEEFDSVITHRDMPN